tara:strand:- start:472 stop:846 length:375 start_codon:yes stop_codon:yes gene_type:complete
MGVTGLEADATLFKIPYDACGCVETEGTTPREYDSVHLLDCVDWVEKSNLTRTGCSSSHIYTCNGTGFGQYDRAPGWTFDQCVVADAHPFYYRQSMPDGFRLCANHRNWHSKKGYKNKRNTGPL